MSQLPCARYLATLFVLQCWLLLLLSLSNAVQCVLLYEEGTRFTGDRLLFNDTIETHWDGFGQEAKFKYPLTAPITAVSIKTAEDVRAEVYFDYHRNLIDGFITTVAIKRDKANNTNGEGRRQLPFKVSISVYGYNETSMAAAANELSYLMKHDRAYYGTLIDEREEYDDGDDEDDYPSGSGSGSGSGELHDNDNQLIELNYNQEWQQNQRNDNEHADFEYLHKIIELGQRQQGDKLLYVAAQESPAKATQLANHTVIFYYIDSNFITYVKFIIYHHFAEKPTTALDYMPPVAEYSHYSPQTLKAAITDNNRTALFVQMLVYGYPAAAVPATHYIPFLPITLPEEWPFRRLVTPTNRTEEEEEEAAAAPTKAKLSALQRLQQLMKAQRPFEEQLTATAATSAVAVVNNSVINDEIGGVEILRSAATQHINGVLDKQLQAAAAAVMTAEAEATPETESTTGATTAGAFGTHVYTNANFGLKLKYSGAAILLACYAYL